MDSEDMLGEEGGKQKSQPVWFHPQEMSQHGRISRDRKQISPCRVLAGRGDRTEEYTVSFRGDENILDVEGPGGRRAWQNVLSVALRGLQRWILC